MRQTRLAKDYMALGDDKEITLKCPKCSRESEQLIGRLKAQGGFTCSGCNVWIATDTSELSAAFEEVERKIRDMARRFQ